VDAGDALVRQGLLRHLESHAGAPLLLELLSALALRAGPATSTSHSDSALPASESKAAAAAESHLNAPALAFVRRHKLLELALPLLAASVDKGRPGEGQSGAAAAAAPLLATAVRLPAAQQTRELQTQACDAVAACIRAGALFS
jgi:hypothetical protein